MKPKKKTSLSLTFSEKSRAIDKALLDWKNESNHKPLLLRGARQVGKSSAVRQLGKSFKYFVEVNFERDKDITSVFTGNLKPKEIASRLSAYYEIPIIAGETLLFLDEIQVCKEAIHSLWFFYEDYQVCILCLSMNLSLQQSNTTT